MLFHATDGKFSHEDWLNMHDWEAINVFFRPNANKEASEGYWPVSRHDDKEGPLIGSSFREEYFRVWRNRGMADEDIEKRFKERNPNYRGG